MADTTTKFGFVNVWARGGQEGLEGLLEEYTIEDGIAISGNISIKEEQAKALIAYLSDPANLTTYGYKLDIGIFYKDDAKVRLGGSISTPYVKESGGGGGKANIRAKRSI